MNIASILRGPALIKWRGATMYSRGGIEAALDTSVTEIDVEPFGIILRPTDTPTLNINFTPDGQLANVAALINRYASTQQGEFINVEEFPVSVNTGTNVLTCGSAHLLTSGDEVMVHARIAMPSGLDKDTRYYARQASSTTLTLHPTAADAVANTNTVVVVSAGTGVVLSVARPLVIHTFSGLKITYFCAALVSVPDLRLTAGDTLLGQCGFQAFIRPGQAPASAADRYYKIEVEALTDTSFDRNSIQIAPPIVDWERGAAWEGLPTREAATVAFTLNSEGLASDAFGEDALGRIFTRLDVQLTAAVQGVTEADVKSALHLHDKVRGELISDGALTVSAGDVTFTMADARLTAGPQNFSSTAQRTGDCVWQAQRSFTDGAPDPLFELTID